METREYEEPRKNEEVSNLLLLQVVREKFSASDFGKSSYSFFYVEVIK